MIEIFFSEKLLIILNLSFSLINPHTKNGSEISINKDGLLVTIIERVRFPDCNQSLQEYSYNSTINNIFSYTEKSFVFKAEYIIPKKNITITSDK